MDRHAKSIVDNNKMLILANRILDMASYLYVACKLFDDMRLRRLLGDKDKGKLEKGSKYLQQKVSQSSPPLIEPKTIFVASTIADILSNYDTASRELTSAPSDAMVRACDRRESVEERIQAISKIEDRKKAACFENVLAYDVVLIRYGIPPPVLSTKELEGDQKLEGDLLLPCNKKSREYETLFEVSRKYQNLLKETLDHIGIPGESVPDPLKVCALWLKGKLPIEGSQGRFDRFVFAGYPFSWLDWAQATVGMTKETWNLWSEARQFEEIMHTRFHNTNHTRTVDVKKRSGPDADRKRADNLLLTWCKKTNDSKSKLNLQDAVNKLQIPAACLAWVTGEKAQKRMVVDSSMGKIYMKSLCADATRRDAHRKARGQA